MSANQRFLAQTLAVMAIGFVAVAAIILNSGDTKSPAGSQPLPGATKPVENIPPLQGSLQGSQPNLQSSAGVQAPTSVQNSSGSEAYQRFENPTPQP